MPVNIKIGQHTHKAIVAANIVLCTCRIAVYLNKFLHCMYYAQMYAAQFAEIILQRPIASSVLDLGCESTFWLIPSLPQCLSSLGTRPSKNRKGGSGTSAGVEVYTAEC